MTSRIAQVAESFGRRGPAHAGIAALGASYPGGVPSRLQPLPPRPDLQTYDERGAGQPPAAECDYGAYLSDHDRDEAGHDTGMSFGATAAAVGAVVTAACAVAAAVLVPKARVLAAISGGAAGAVASTAGTVYQYTQWRDAGGTAHREGACEGNPTAAAYGARNP